MSVAGIIRAGEAFVELIAKDDKLAEGLRSAQEKVKRWVDTVSSLTNKLGVIGLGIEGLFGAAVKKFVELGKSQAELAKQAGMSSEAFSELSAVVRATNGNVKDLATGSAAMQNAISELTAGSERGRQALGSLGLTMANLAGISGDERFTRVADALNGIADPAERAAAAARVFGDASAGLLPVVALGAQGIDALRGQAAGLGLTMSSKSVVAATRFAEKLDKLHESLSALVAKIGEAVLPAFQSIVDLGTNLVKSVSRWIDQNQALLGTLEEVARKSLAVAGAIIAIRYAMQKAAVTAALISAAFAAITSPVGLVIAGVTALGVYLAKYTEAGRAAIANLGEAFARLAEIAGQAWTGIKAALEAGDLTGAFEIVAASLKLAWISALVAIEERYSGWMEFLIGGAINVAAAIATSFNAGLANLHRGILIFAQGISVVFETIGRTVEDVFVAMARFVFDAINKVLNFFGKGTDQAVLEANRKVADLEKQKRRDSSDGSRGLRFVRGLAKADQDQADRQKSIDAVKEKARSYIPKADRKDLEKAQKQFDSAVNKARTKATEAPKAAEVKEEEIKEEIPETAAKHGPGAARGTFNAMGVQGLASGGPMERVAKATETVAKNTTELLRKTGTPAYRT